MGYTFRFCEAYQDFQSVEHMAAESDLSEQQIQLALAYWEAYPEEIDEHIAGNRRPLEELQKVLPSMIIVQPDD